MPSFGRAGNAAYQDVPGVYVSAGQYYQTTALLIDY